MINKKILIAEDSSVIQHLVKKILTQIKYDVTPAKNGKQVIKYLEKDRYDLILLDIHMPVMGGMECAQAIRKLPNEASSIPIIAITGNVNNYSPKDFENAGINDFLPKPLNYDSLVEMVKEYV